MIDVRVGQEHEIKFARAAVANFVVAFLEGVVPLEHAAVHGKTCRLRLDDVAGTCDGLRRAMEGHFHKLSLQYDAFFDEGDYIFRSVADGDEFQG